MTKISAAEHLNDILLAPVGRGGGSWRGLAEVAVDAVGSRRENKLKRSKIKTISYVNEAGNREKEILNSSASCTVLMSVVECRPRETLSGVRFRHRQGDCALLVFVM